MPNTIYRIFDNNTGDEIYPSDGFRFIAAPAPDHRIRDAELMARYGSPAVVNRVESKDGEVHVFVDGDEELMNAGNEDDENYRRS